jgi:uncharacterized peroxidase-related enzyme
MPYIHLRDDLYGITSLLDFRKETAAPLCELTQVLLRGESTLTPAERELIAAYVSSLNDCVFCSSAHSAATCALPGGDATGMKPMMEDISALHISQKMISLLQLAAKVQQGGLYVKQEDVDEAKEVGATDLEIHDTVLIAALFCLYNRYVDGLATRRSEDPEFYKALGQRVTTRGYKMPEDGYHPLIYNKTV